MAKMFYLISGAAALVGAYASKGNANTELAKTPVETRGDLAVVGEAGDLASFSVKTLTEVFNSCQADETTHIKKLGGKTDKDLAKVFNAMEMKHNPSVKEKAEKEAAKAKAKADKEAARAEKAAAKGATGEKKESTGIPRETSKAGKLYLHLQANPKGSTIEALAEASGYDEQNARTCIGILRSKKGLLVNYDRTSKLYTLGEAAAA